MGQIVHFGLHAEMKSSGYFMEQNKKLRKHGTTLQLRSCDVLDYVNVNVLYRV